MGISKGARCHYLTNTATISKTYSIDLRVLRGVRGRLPAAQFPKTIRYANGLLEIADDIDTFVFDAYGVLNVGGTAIPGAAETVSALRKLGKKVFVLTNGATFPFEHSIQKFKNLEFDFQPDEIFSSRMGTEN